MCVCPPPWAVCALLGTSNCPHPWRGGQGWRSCGPWGGPSAGGDSALAGAVLGDPQDPDLSPCPLQNGVISLIDCTLVEEPESTDEDGTWWGWSESGSNSGVSGFEEPRIEV